MVCSDGSLLDPGPCARAAWGIKQVGSRASNWRARWQAHRRFPGQNSPQCVWQRNWARHHLVVVVDHLNLAAHWADAQGRLDDCLTSPLVDLWERLQAAIAGGPQGSFAIRWIPSHMDELETSVREARRRKACAAGSIPAAWIAGTRGQTNWQALQLSSTGCLGL